MLTKVLAVKFDNELDIDFPLWKKSGFQEFEFNLDADLIVVSTGELTELVKVALEKQCNVQTRYEFVMLVPKSPPPIKLDIKRLASNSRK